MPLFFLSLCFFSVSDSFSRSRSPRGSVFGYVSPHIAISIAAFVDILNRSRRIQSHTVCPIWWTCVYLFCFPSVLYINKKKSLWHSHNLDHRHVLFALDSAVALFERQKEHIKQTIGIGGENRFGVSLIQITSVRKYLPISNDFKGATTTNNRIKICENRFIIYCHGSYILCKILYCLHKILPHDR